MTDYDVVIVGGSFAGLTVANQLCGHRVLVIDRKPIGSGQTSACGTMLRVLNHWGLAEAVLQVHDRITLHTNSGILEFPTKYSWCTFNYAHLCEELLVRSEAEFLKTSVQGYDGERVVTSDGSFRAHCVVDASGWRAILTSDKESNSAGRTRSMNFGMETIQPLNGNRLDPSALHFYYDPHIFPIGVGWVFPRNGTAIIGVGSYRGAGQLLQSLEQFTTQLGIHRGELHGTYFPSKYRAPTVGNVFVVGDAAGMCIALTGEGFRPAMYFGEACGHIIRRVLAGELRFNDGLAEYRAFVESKRLFFDIFTAAQSVLTRLPRTYVDWIAYGIHLDRVRRLVFDKYWELTREWSEPV